MREHLGGFVPWAGVSACFGRPLSYDKTAHNNPEIMPTQLPSMLPQAREQAAREELERVMGHGSRKK